MPLIGSTPAPSILGNCTATYPGWLREKKLRAETSEILILRGGGGGGEGKGGEGKGGEGRGTSVGLDPWRSVADGR